MRTGPDHQSNYRTQASETMMRSNDGTLRLMAKSDGAAEFSACVGKFVI
jgi:hypothetical protein